MKQYTKSINGRSAIPGMSVKAVTEHGIEIEGYGVLFDLTDLQGETFKADTDYWIDQFGGTKRPLLWDHSFDSEGPGLDPIGQVQSIKADDVGLWFEATIDRAGKYAEMIERLVEMGVVGASTGAPLHMTRNIGSTIASWPIVELSLTPTPAEPNTVGGIDEVKAALESVGYKSVVALDRPPTSGAKVPPNASAGDAADSTDDSSSAESTAEPTESEVNVRLDLEREQLLLSEMNSDEGLTGEDQG